MLSIVIRYYCSDSLLLKIANAHKSLYIIIQFNYQTQVLKLTSTIYPTKPSVR